MPVEPFLTAADVVKLLRFDERGVFSEARIRGLMQSGDIESINIGKTDSERRTLVTTSSRVAEWQDRLFCRKADALNPRLQQPSRHPAMSIR